MKKKRPIKRIIIISVASLFLLAVTAAVLLFAIKRYPVCSLASEIPNGSLSLNDTAKADIYDIIDGMYVSDGYNDGFMSEFGSLSLYDIYSLSEYCRTINRPDLLDPYRNKIICVLQNSPVNYDILNLNYYVVLCRRFGVEIDKEKVISLYERYYDKNTKLFFYISETDSLSSKAVITANSCRDFPELLSDDRFDIVAGVKAACDATSFVFDRLSTFYTSGAEIVYLYDTLELIDDSFLDAHREWLDDWRDYYESIKISDKLSLMVYSEFYKIAKLFYPDYSKDIIDEYFAENWQEITSGFGDILMLSDCIAYADIDSVSAAADKLALIVGERVDTLLNVSDSIDVYSTFLGLMLANEAGYSYNSDNIRNVIDAEYDKASELRLGYEAVCRLYYALYTDKLLNGTITQAREKEMQDIVNRQLYFIDYYPDKYQQSLGLRRLVEIIAEANDAGYSVSMNNFQYLKLKALVRKLVEEEKGSPLAVELFLIDKCMGFGFCNEDYLEEAYKCTLKDGGNTFPEDANGPQIDSTYRFFVCRDYIQDIGEMRSFIDKLYIKDGIYAYDDKVSFYNLESVLYGNYVRSFFDTMK